MDTRVVLVMGYMAEFRFHSPIYNSVVPKELWVYLSHYHLNIHENGCENNVPFDDSIVQDVSAVEP